MAKNSPTPSVAFKLALILNCSIQPFQTPDSLKFVLRACGSRRGSAANQREVSPTPKLRHGTEVHHHPPTTGCCSSLQYPGEGWQTRMDAVLYD